MLEEEKEKEEEEACICEKSSFLGSPKETTVITQGPGIEVNPFLRSFWTIPGTCSPILASRAIRSGLVVVRIGRSRGLLVKSTKFISQSVV